MKKTEASKNCKTVYKNCCVHGEITDITVTDGVFSHIGKTDECGIDLGGYDVFPGLIDIHCHGANGRTVYGIDNSLLKGNLENISDYFAKCGVTTWYPTTSSPAESLSYMLSLDFEAIGGANIPGIHLEGPYLSLNKPGAINPKNMRLPRASDFESYDKIKYITVKIFCEN